jgi:hypothetical protein
MHASCSRQQVLLTGRNIIEPREPELSIFNAFNGTKLAIAMYCGGTAPTASEGLNSNSQWEWGK